MLVLGDDLPQYETPWLTYGVMLLCSAVFILQSVAPFHGLALLIKFGCMPAIVTGHLSYGADFGHMHGALTLLTSAFLHANLVHLLGNMLFLWTFGKHVEESFERPIYAIFIVLCAIASSLAQVLSNPGTTVPTIGASGFISGIMGAYLVLFPMARLTVPFGTVWLALTGRWSGQIPAFVVLGFWITEQVFLSRGNHSGAGSVAHWAHIGGFVSGAAGGFLLRWCGLAATYYEPERAAT